MIKTPTGFAFVILFVTTIANAQSPAPTAASDRDTQTRLELWSKYRANCANPPNARAFDGEISLYAPAHSRRKGTLNYKSFCECRYDGLNKALGLDLASYQVSFKAPVLPSDEQMKYFNTNKAVFERCFVAHSSASAPSVVGPPIADEQLRSILRRVQDECIAKRSEINLQGVAKFNQATSKEEENQARKEADVKLKALGEECTAKQDKIYELQRKPVSERVLPAGF